MIHYIKSLAKTTVIIYPEGTRTEAKSFIVNGRRMLVYLLIFTLITGLLGFYSIYLTPLERIFLPSWLKKTTLEEQQYEELSSKIVFLTKELENLKSTNIKLRNAIQLGDSSILKHKNEKVKENTQNTKIPAEGNLVTAVQKLFSELFRDEQPDNDVFFISPVKGYISREYKPNQGHYGVDYVVKENTPVYAAASGYIIFANYTTQYGYTIIISHSSGYISKYLHCNQILKREGDVVKQGELIALSGNSGTDTTGPHLHFEIWKDGQAIDPPKVLLNN